MNTPFQCEKYQQSILRFLDARKYEVTQLAGDASTRQYFRVLSASGSFIILDAGHPFTEDSDDFLLIGKMLADLGLPVPKIFQVFPQQGWMFCEDLGDMSLQTFHSSHGIQAIEKLYHDAIDLIVRMQKDCQPEKIPWNPAFSRSFDEAKLLDELMFFETHFFYGFLKIKATVVERTILDKGYRSLVGELARHSKWFTHRDFHSRNLMVHDNQLWMIDFQDARLGPAVYDLASLLRDAYVRLPESLINELKQSFFQQIACCSSEEAEDLFTLMCIQRNLKALGTFGNQAVNRGNRTYLQYVPVLLDHLSVEIPRIRQGSIRDMGRCVYGYLAERVSHVSK